MEAKPGKNEQKVKSQKNHTQSVGLVEDTKRLPPTTHSLGKAGTTTVSKYVMENRREREAEWFVYYEERQNWRYKDGEKQPHVNSPCCHLTSW